MESLMVDVVVIWLVNDAHWRLVPDEFKLSM